MEAPEGTAARPKAPEASVTSASTVGLPRLSTIWRAVTFSIRSCGLAFYLFAVAVGSAPELQLGVGAGVHRCAHGRQQRLTVPLARPDRPHRPRGRA